jgi:iron complex outermembrane receptor protein
LPVNSGTAKVPGVELELEWYMSERWSLDVSASQMDFEFQETVAPITTSMVPPYTPETKWSAGIQYNHPLNAGGQFGVRLDANYQDDIYVLPVNHPSNLIEGYELINARFMWESSDGLWDAALEITNAGDEYYFHTLFDQLNSGGGYVSGQPGHPRMFAITINRTF